MRKHKRNHDVKESVYPETELSCLLSKTLTLVFSPYIRCIFKITSQINL